MKLAGSDIVMRQVTNKSSIAELGIDEFKQQLKIKFAGGSIYLYKDVNPVLLNEIIQSETPERIYYKNIQGVYGYTRIYKAPSQWIDPREKTLKLKGE
jgi:hypothetical protein